MKITVEKEIINGEESTKNSIDVDNLDSVVSTRLKNLRELNRYSQADIAKALDMSVVGYQKIEYGTRSLSIDKLIKLSFHYGVSVELILGLTDKSEVVERRTIDLSSNE